jgi:putative transposase
MLVNKAYKFRIYPTKAQEVLTAKTIGCSRYVFNHFLAKWNETYKETGTGLSYGVCSSELPNLKKELPWLKEVESIAIQSSVKDTKTKRLKALTCVNGLALLAIANGIGT